MTGTPRLLTLEDRDHWLVVLDRIGAYDVYDLPDYAALASVNKEGTPGLFVYQEGPHVIALPIVERDIAGTGFRDVTSVYGYAGPVATPAVPQDAICRFQDAFADLCHERAIVCSFSRLHPLLPQRHLLAGLGDTVDIGWTLSIDLRSSQAAQVADYRKSHRYDIRRLRGTQLDCRVVGAAHLDAFIAMYHDTMAQCGASPYYFFPKEYFVRLLEGLGEHAQLVLCFDGDTPVCGGIFTRCQGIVQYHLSGSAAACKQFAPTKLMLDEVRQRACDAGDRVLHLGGGLGGRRDSLFGFKSGFTRTEHVYSIWRHIADPPAYQALVDARCRQTGLYPDEGYFPLYRHPALYSSARPIDCTSTACGFA